MDDLARAPRRLPQVSGKFVLVVAAAAVVVALAGVYLQRRGVSNGNLHYVAARVARGDISAGVQETGPIAAATAVPLNFKNSGKVSEIDVKAGDQVKAGQMLAKLDPTDLQSQLRQAQATLDAAQAGYNKLVQGPTQADVAVAQAAVDTTSRQVSDTQTQAAKDADANQHALDNARKNLTAAQAQVDAATAADKSAVQGAQQTLADAQKQLSALTPVIAQQIATAKAKLYADQTTWDAQVGRGAATKEQRQSALDADQSAIDQANAAAQQQTVQAQAAVNQAQTALNGANAALQNDLAKFQGQLTAAQAQVDAAQDALNTAAAKDQAQINAATSALQTAKANYDKTVQPPTQADVDNAKALVAAQQAQVELAQNNLDAAVLASPSDGVITAVNGAVGQWLTGGSISGQAASAASGASTSSTNTNSGNFISLTDLSGLQVDAQVNEADVGRVKPGQPVKFTIDAFPGQTFEGKVAVVQPLGASSNNVVTYTVTIDINSTSVQLLPGMTANVTILTTSVPDTIIIPSSAISFGQSQAGGASATSAQPKPAASAGAQPSGAAASPAASLAPRPSGSATVTVVANGKGSPRQIQVGVSDDRNTRVLSGLSPGEEVATGTTSS